jgi:fatty-acyl-CoA synthase
VIGGDILGERARLTPDRPALVYVPTGERFTYRQLNERACRCAHLWRDVCRLKPGDRAGILAENRVEFLDAFFAAGKLGIILVPLSTRMTAHELAYIARDSGLACLLYSSRFAETARTLRQAISVERWIALDEPLDPGDLNYAHSLASLPCDEVGERCDPEDIHCLLYTSGTTGKPKGVMIPHRMVAWNGYNTAACWQLRDDDVSSIFTPLYHAGGLSVFLVPLFTIGGRIVLHDGFDPSQVWRTIAAEKCTVIFGVPTIFKMLMEAPEFQSADLSRVRWCISGGAPLPLDIIEAYQKRGVVFKQGYGLTEVGVNCFSMTAEESVRKPGSVGKPMMFTEARLVDSSGHELPRGEVGELLLRGPHVSKGYWNNPEATADARDERGWFHTGDLARCDSEGFFYIAGRLKDMIISGGLNIYPAEIEAELLRHPAVQDAAVVGVPDATWGEAGVAFVVLRGPKEVTAAELSAFLAARLAKYKIPKDFIFVESLPRTSYGKVTKGELREAYLRSGSNVPGH